MMVGFYKQQVPGWTQVAQQQIQVGGRQGLHIRATGKPQGMQLVADYILVLSDRNQFVLTLSCQQAQAQQWQGTFQQIVQSWQVR